MSDPNSSYGEPVEEPTEIDDVVGQAHEGLADAEAAGRDAVESGEHADGGAWGNQHAGEQHAGEQVNEQSGGNAANDWSGAASGTDSSGNEWSADRGAQAADAQADSGAHADNAAHDNAAQAESGAHDPLAGYEWPAPAASTDNNAPADNAASVDNTATAAEAETVVVDSASADAPTVVAAPIVAPAVTPSEPVVEEPAYAAPSPQPIFVQAPEAPRARGNRGAAGGIGLLAALAFAVLYLGARLGFGAIDGDVTIDNIGEKALDAVGTWSLWVPVVVFYIGFWLLGSIINRGRWGAWVVFGLFVGVVSYGGHILGQLFQAPFWTLTAREGNELVNGELLAPLAIAAFVIGRELTIWFGAWVAARGKRVTEINNEAQREYERTLEAGPQLAQR